MKLIQKAVVEKDGKFLIVLRSSQAVLFPEHWDFPGGKLEPGEEPFAGLEREVLEETGLKVNALGVVSVYEMVLKNIPHRFTVYYTKILGGKVKLSSEHTDFKWATKQEILGLKTEPFMKKYFEEH
ncbi:MAG: NUDIX hydrolase [Candidatus Micrarchaeota archaeon]